jgi:hypothetical protein
VRRSSRWPLTGLGSPLTNAGWAPREVARAAGVLR